MNDRASFLKRLHEAAHWEAYVAAEFTREGFHVLLGPCKRLKGQDFSQSIDLRVTSDPPYTDIYDWHPVEVKSSWIKVDEDNHVLVCAEKSFDNHAGANATTLYANWVFVSPQTGLKVCFPKGTPIIRGKQQWDTQRNQIYGVIKAERKHLIPFRDLCKYLKA